MIYTICDIDKIGPESIELVDGATRLSDNFTVEEVACKDGNEVVLYSSRLVRYVQALRDFLGHALWASSWFRTWTHNDRVGGVSNSRHLFAIAVDLVTPHYMSGARFEEIILSVFPEGTYTYVGSGFVHVDLRGVVWNEE